MAPSRKTDVTSSLLTLSQNVSVLKAATTPIEPPTQSAVLATNVPPMWKIGMWRSWRSSGRVHVQVAGFTAVKACM